jgi:hypothetical protein
VRSNSSTGTTQRLYHDNQTAASGAAERTMCRASGLRPGGTATAPWTPAGGAREGTRRVQLVREEGTRRVQLVREEGGGGSWTPPAASRAPPAGAHSAAAPTTGRPPAPDKAGRGGEVITRRGAFVRSGALRFVRRACASPPGGRRGVRTSVTSSKPPSFQSPESATITLARDTFPCTSLQSAFRNLPPAEARHRQRADFS